jgi:uncharacterized protein
MTLLVLPIMFFSALTFGLTGFGSALVAMPLLTPLLGVEVAAPLFALLALVLEMVSLVRYRRHLRFQAVWRLMLASLLAIPIGVTLAQALPERVVLLLLGLVVAGYGLYRLLKLPLPHLANPNFAFGFGFVGGLLSGAYNTGGPPVVIYGNMSRWSPAEFKSSLQGFFLVNSTLVVTLHLINRHMTPDVLQGVLLSVPVVLLGLWLGWQLERRVNPVVFERLVLIVLVLVGGRLVLANLL